ncbi:hypothetical protein N7G274_009741 [Stereocaulon virgatum]|uniref:FAD/NAD(P)-binding domain-containing protein n=1 Tax=Stereocaulon virgatum TaxID=373712 RepID=A0ABR3ZXN8_9LECA
MATSKSADIFIVGGGPAGLSAALTLARHHYSIVFFDSGSYRNASATRLNLVPGWENKAPEDFRKTSREEISRYDNIEFRDREITYIVKTREGRFLLMDSLYIMWSGRKIILATGSADVFPNINGYEELWAVSIFANLFYQNVEEGGKDRTSGVLAVDLCADPAIAVRLSENAAQYTSSVTIYTNGQEELGQQIEAASGDGNKYNVDARPIKCIRKSRTGPEVIIYFEDGSKTPEAFLVHTPTTQLKGTLAGQIDLELTPEGEIKAEAPFYQTSMKGVFAAGDCVTPHKTTAGAMSSGCSAALAVAMQLQAEDAGHDSIV